MKSLKFICLIVFTLTITSCGFYSFNTASIPDTTKTFQVNFFNNNAAFIEPGLDRTFTNTLRDLLRNQTRLDEVSSNGDIIYEGEITEYRVSPTSSNADNVAAENRLTISVNVRFYDNNNSESDFEKRFSFFFDFAGPADLSGTIRDTAIEEIFERITQDIFNESLAKW